MTDQLQWPSLKSLWNIDDVSGVRRNLVGGSDANVILSGNADRIRQLWLEKRGEVQAKRPVDSPAGNARHVD